MVAVAHRVELAMPSGLLAFHVGGVKSEGGEVCIAVGFGPVANQKCDEEDDRHRCIDRPALPLILDHAAEGMSERAAEISRMYSTSRKLLMAVGFS